MTRSMAFQIDISEDAERQFNGLTAREQATLESAIANRLVNEPTRITRAIKRLRPNPFAQFELRVGDLRVLYNVEADTVLLLLIGRKAGNKLVVEGEEFHGHQDDPAQHSGGESRPDAQ